MEKQKNIPSLRFPEFSGEWTVNLLSEIAEKRIIKNKDNNVKNVFTNSAIHGIVNQRDFFDKDIANQNNLLGYYIVEKNDFVYNPRISNYAPVGPISRNNLNTGIMSPLYSVFRFRIGNNDFIEMYFNTTIWHKHMEDIANYGARDDRMSFSTGDFYRMPINLPTIPEQTIIASFLTKVDEKLSALKKKKELLEQYKKGVMQQIFSQELRFKDDDGNDYPEWEEKTLGNTLDITVDNRGKTPPTLEYGIPLLEVNSIGNKDIKYKVVSKFVNDQTFETWFRKYLKEGDVLFSTVGNTALCSYYDGKIKACIAQNIVGLRFKTEIGLFMYYLLIEDRNNNKFKQIEMGAVQPSVKVSQMIDLYFDIPCLKEQKKIADFLSTIDNKISYCQSQIEKAEVWKKGLLQQMFC